MTTKQPANVRDTVAERETPPPAVTGREAIRSIVERNADAVGASLPTGYSQQRFTRLLLTAANTNPGLFECDPRSFLAAGIGAAQLGLEPNDARGLAYLLPFQDRRNNRKVVQLIIGYRGMLDLARRSGMVSSINAFPVFRQDTFTYSLGLEPDLLHVPADHDEDPADLVYVYAVAKVQGDNQFVVMTRRQIDKVRAGSPGARSDRSPWTTHYTEMALKTALRRLCKWLPQSVEVAHAIERDERDLTLDAGTIGYGIIDPDETIDTETIDPDTGEILGSGERQGDGGNGSLGGELPLSPSPATGEDATP